MIMGIGVDMVSEARVARSIKRPGFLEKVYGPAERALLEGRGMRPQTAAANFAAKEAFGLLREFALCEAEALRDENGAPYFSFSGRAAALMQARGLTAHLSLTHEGGTAAAFVVLERREASASLKEEPECSTLR